MSTGNDFGISEIGNQIHGLTQSAYNSNNVLVSSDLQLGDKANSNQNPQIYRIIEDDEHKKNEHNVHIDHFYINENIIVPDLEPYRYSEVVYGDEYELTKNNKFLILEERKKAYNGEEDHIFCGRFPHLTDCGCTYPCSIIIPKVHPIEVIDNIFCGSIEVAYKTKELLYLKIKNILNLSCVAYNKRIKYFHYYDIYINDNNTENVIKYFKITNRFIEQSIQNGGKILIHSEKGKCRCWVFLMAYLIGRRHMTFNIANDLVKSKFNYVDINDNFLTQLKHYDLKVNI